MQIIIIITFFLLFVMIPVGLLFVSAKVYGNGVDWLVVLGRLLASIVLYLTASIIVPIMILIFIVYPYQRAGDGFNFGFAAQSICLLGVAGYGGVGWLLCSLVNGKFIKSFSEFNLSYEKPQSIF